MSDLEQLKKAAARLEEQETEYSLQVIVSESGLTESTVLQLLKQYWIDADELDILYLNLDPIQEAGLYQQLPQ